MLPIRLDAVSFPGDKVKVVTYDYSTWWLEETPKRFNFFFVLKTFMSTKGFNGIFYAKKLSTPLIFAVLHFIDF